MLLVGQYSTGKTTLIKYTASFSFSFLFSFSFTFSFFHLLISSLHLLPLPPRYLLGESFQGCRIGPEPTTDKFHVIMGGEEVRP